MSKGSWDFIKPVNKWAERIYAETDFGRNIAVSGAGLVALAIYLVFSDGIIALCALVIVFPLLRVVSTSLHERSSIRANRRVALEKAEREYARLGHGEKSVLDAFLLSGTCVLTWRQTWELGAHPSSVESLVERGFVKKDQECEMYILDTALFDVARSLQIVEPPF